MRYRRRSYGMRRRRRSRGMRFRRVRPARGGIML